jgi:hypothetical protein
MKKKQRVEGTEEDLQPLTVNTKISCEFDTEEETRDTLSLPSLLIARTHHRRRRRQRSVVLLAPVIALLFFYLFGNHSLNDESLSSGCNTGAPCATALSVKDDGHPKVVLSSRSNDSQAIQHVVYPNYNASSSLSSQPNGGNNNDSRKQPPASLWPSCSCFNSSAEENISTCCRRAVARIHKGGTFLTNKLFVKPFAPKVKGNDVAYKALRRASAMMDYRHAVVIRNMYEAIVSGYLYHQDGYCQETRLENGTIIPIPFDTLLTYNSTNGRSYYEPQKGRNICQYLREESEEMGLRVYIDFALNMYYYGIMKYWDEAQSRLNMGGQERSRLFCYEDLVDPSKQVSVWHSIMDWLYPGGNPYEFPIEPPKSEYNGNHATNHDPKMRQRLRSIVRILDEEVFENRLGKMHARFGCGANI